MKSRMEWVRFAWKKKNSNAWFRSRVLRVMSPARFHCATSHKVSIDFGKIA